MYERQDHATFQQIKTVEFEHSEPAQIAELPLLEGNGDGVPLRTDAAVAERTPLA